MKQPTTITIHPKIVTIGAPSLRMGSSLVLDFELAGAHCQKLINLLRELKGAGLAAPQVGINERIIVVEIKKTELFPDRLESPLYVMINPQILEFSEELEEGWEGCFSVPGLVGLVPRAKEIKVKYQSEDGLEKIEIFKDYLARVIQHEYDHLDGCIYLDRMTKIDALSTLDNYKTNHHQL